MPKHIIFADTGAEPDYTLKNVETVFSIAESAGYDCHLVKAEDTILDNFLSLKGRGRGVFAVPYYSRDENGKMGLLRRQCTRIYKIEPIVKKMRSILGYEPRQRISAETAKLWLGISVEEVRRASTSRYPWIQNQYPLVDLRLDRTACAVYAFKILGYQVQKSSCFFCPFKHSEEWVSMKRDRPELFAKAVEFDRKIRNIPTFGNRSGELYVHRSGFPLEDAVGQGVQLSLFSNITNQSDQECSGNCFV